MSRVGADAFVRPASKATVSIRYLVGNVETLNESGGRKMWGQQPSAVQPAKAGLCVSLSNVDRS